MKAAIVTGVSRGLGEALAAELLTRKYTVTGIGRASARRLQGVHYHFAPCDLADIASIESSLDPLFRSIAAARPQSVCLINNAATAEPVGALGTFDAAAVADALSVNLVAPVVLANMFVKTFARGGAASLLINVSSGLAERALPGTGPYSIAKCGLEMLTRQVVADAQATELRAISVRPGVIDTGMQTFMRSQSREAFGNVDMFRDFHASGALVPPDVVAAKIVDRLVEGAVENGRCYSYREL